MEVKFVPRRRPPNEGRSIESSQEAAIHIIVYILCFNLLLFFFLACSLASESSRRPSTLDPALELCRFASLHVPRAFIQRTDLLRRSRVVLSSYDMAFGKLRPTVLGMATGRWSPIGNDLTIMTLMPCGPRTQSGLLK